MAGITTSPFQVALIADLGFGTGAAGRAQVMKQLAGVLAEVNRHVAAVTPLAVSDDGGVQGVYAAPHLGFEASLQLRLELLGTADVLIGLGCRDELAGRMDRRDARITLGLLRGMSQQEIGREVKIAQSAVSGRLKRNGAYAILMARERLEAIAKGEGWPGGSAIPASGTRRGPGAGNDKPGTGPGDAERKPGSSPGAGGSKPGSAPGVGGGKPGIRPGVGGKPGKATK